jgi:hypothetical protein
VSHFASEWLWLETAAERLGSVLAGAQFTVSVISTDPWDFSVAAHHLRDQSET